MVAQRVFFRSFRGLRQGDPLSPLIFFMVFEVLRKMTRKGEKNFFPGFSVGQGKVKVSHLQFVDDTMIFCDADVRQLGFLRCLLRCFEAVSGLNINLAKSEHFSMGVISDIDRMARILGCKIGSLPSTYLGLPLGATHKSKVVWEPVSERIGYHLEAWRASLLSTGGRLTLLKST